MKKVLIVLFITATSISAQAQEYKETIKTTFTEYLDALVNSDFDKAMDYMLPEFFELIPRAELIMVMEKTFNNPQMSFKISNPKVLQVDDAQVIEGKSYASLVYSNDMQIKIKGEEDETEERKAMRVGLTQGAFVQSFGKDNVAYDEATDSFKVHAEKSVYAISKDGKTDWKFIVLEQRQREMLEKLLPEALLEQN
ncbi:hypothetical protein [Leeuwenhoekiella sp. LLG6367-2.1]|uniref:hypothetical protein n=1 Tax=Leeuwenhoekiella sp. LLG6367-2.1 TaxID=3160833 RepID=UPI00386EAA0D